MSDYFPHHSLNFPPPTPPPKIRQTPLPPGHDDGNGPPPTSPPPGHGDDDGDGPPPMSPPPGHGDGDGDGPPPMSLPLPPGHGDGDGPPPMSPPLPPGQPHCLVVNYLTTVMMMVPSKIEPTQTAQPVGNFPGNQVATDQAIQMVETSFVAIWSDRPSRQLPSDLLGVIGGFSIIDTTGADTKPNFCSSSWDQFIEPNGRRSTSFKATELDKQAIISAITLFNPEFSLDFKLGLNELKVAYVEALNETTSSLLEMDVSGLKNFISKVWKGEELPLQIQLILNLEETQQSREKLLQAIILNFSRKTGIIVYLADGLHRCTAFFWALLGIFPAGVTVDSDTETKLHEFLGRCLAFSLLV
jgi:hypothetical protein